MKPLLQTLLAAAVVGGTIGCGSDTSGPSPNVTAVATDPAGDTFGTGSVQWDLTTLTIARDGGGITVSLDLSAAVVSPVTGSADATLAFVDFDTDQNIATGTSSIVDDNRPSTGSTGMGVDYYIDLADPNPDSSFSVLDSLANVKGTVRPTFSGSRITARIPRSMLGGDDAFLNAAAIVGTSSEPTDIIPENGHLKVGGIGTVAPFRPQLSALGGTRKWKVR
ncbi:MAG TPA: hypothetical protein VI007_04380 [bacterium]